MAHTQPLEVDPYRMEALGREMDHRNKNDHGHNGSTRFINWSLAMLNGLAIAAVVGGIMMYGRVSALEQRAIALEQKVDLIITGHIHIAGQ